MHPKALARMAGALKSTTCRARQDEILDELGDATLRATEWDADQWGFDADRWMLLERMALASRGGPFWPREVI